MKVGVEHFEDNSGIFVYISFVLVLLIFKNVLSHVNEVSSASCVHRCALLMKKKSIFSGKFRRKYKICA